jgi:hypothetical protein
MPPFMPIPPKGLLICAASPLMHFVKGDMRDFVVRYAGHDGRHQRLRKLGAQGQFIALVGRNRKHDAAQAGNLQQKIPALRIGDVAHLNEIGNRGSKVERRAYHQEALGPRKTLELDPEGAPHIAAGAVGADQPSAATRLGAAAPVDRDLDS